MVNWNLFHGSGFFLYVLPTTQKNEIVEWVHPSIDGPTLLVRSKEGLKVTMDLDFEYILTPLRL